jgi:sugar lactone lactonase YvrE
MRTHRIIWLLIPLLAAACDQRTSILIDNQGPRAATALELSVKLPERERRQTLAPPSLTPPLSVLVLLPDVAQTVELTLTGTEDGGRVLTSYQSVRSVPHQQVRVTMPLYGEGDDMAMAEDLAGADLTGYVEDLAAADFSNLDSDGGSGDLGAVPTLKLLAGTPGGNGWYDSTGKDARLSVPNQAVLIGTSLYLVEEFSGRLRKVDVTNGAVTTVQLFRASDNLPTTLEGPKGLASDGAGFLYVACSYDSTVRKINLADGKVSLVAGMADVEGSTDSPALFATPFGLALDGAGNLWVSDADNYTIRKIALSGPTVTTIAGTAGAPQHLDGSGASARFTFPRGLALYQNDLYVTDSSSVRRVQISVSPAPVTTLITPNSAWDTGTGIASAGAGVFYVIDQAQNNLRRVTGTNTQSVVAGIESYFAEFVDGIGSAARFTDPRWIVLDGAGQAYITEGAAVRKVDLANFSVTTLAGMSPQNGSTDSPNARFNAPSGMAYDGNDTIYITDYANNLIRKMTLSTGNVVTFAGNGGYQSMDGTGLNASFGGPSAAAIDGAGNLYVADYGSSCVRKVTIPGAVATTIAGHCNTPGAPSPSPIPGASAYFSTPNGLAFDGDHTLFVADSGNHAIRSIDITGAPFTVSHVGGNGTNNVIDGVGAAAGFNTPIGLAWEASTQRLYVAEYGSGVVRQIDLTDRGAPNTTTLVGDEYSYTHIDGAFATATFGALFGLAIDPARRFLFVGDADGQLVRRINLAAQTVSTVVGAVGVPVTKPGPLPALVHTPKGLVWTPLGLVISSWDEHTILLATGL